MLDYQYRIGIFMGVTVNEQRNNILILLVLALLLAACAPQQPAPTAFAMPTLAEIATMTPVSVIAERSPIPEDTELAIATAPGTTTPSQTPTQTLTTTITLTASITYTPSPTITDTPLPTVTSTPREVSGLEGLAQLAREATVLPRDFRIDGTPVRPTINAPIQGTPSNLTSVFDFLDDLPGASTFAEFTARNEQFTNAANCSNTAPGGFGELENSDFSVRALLGCPQNDPAIAITANSAYQPFERGFMLWVDTAGTGTIYVVLNNGSYQAIADTWNPDVDPERGNETPPNPNLIEPIRGFGKVWRNNSNIRSTLGWATAPEQGNDAVYTPYQQGTLLYAPQRGEITAFGNSGSWRAYSGNY
jgi:hypothetical protein